MPPPELLSLAGSSGIHQLRNPTFKMLSRSQDPSLSLDERLKILYPMVNEEETPLPRCWSAKDKFSYIGLSLNNLRVQYKGHGKTHKDASSVRATHPIPASCGIYYFEVRIVSKGRDGYMGVGLCAQGVNMNRLPGWDKHSYGYHGDDGHSFCSSGTGQAYGPAFTTGDVIGCGLNLVDGTCFYTKNGHHLGAAFSDLPPQLYPTVGLQTPGEVVDANFGQEPFVFDIEGEMADLRTRIHRDIESFPVPAKHGDWQTTLNKLICSYLVHHGFCNTAEAFSRATGQVVSEEWISIKNRQQIQKLILAGKMGEAISTTDALYPGFLTKRPSLLFTLKVRQFIEMAGGRDADSDDVISTESQELAEKDESEISDDDEEDGNTNDSSGDVVMTNGNNKANGANVQVSSNEETMEVDPPSTRLSVASNPERFNHLLQFGQGLKAMLQDMESHSDNNQEANTLMLRDAFALLAYPDPWNSPLGWQLATSQRELIANALNSALIEAGGSASRPPLEVALCHGKQLVRSMAAHEIGACAFANLDDFIK